VDHSIGARAQEHNAKGLASEQLLMLDVAIHRNECVELARCSLDQLAVLQPPAIPVR